jgi:hypothetical protein
VLLLAETAAATGDHAQVLRTVSECLDLLDTRRASSRAFVFRARALVQAIPDDPELRFLRSSTLRRLGGRG